MAAPVIRDAGPADAAALAELSGELGYPALEQAIRDRLEALGGMPLERVLAAEDSASGRVVGWLHVGVRIALESGPRGEILGLVVSDRARGSGVGSALLKEAEEWTLSTGHGEMLVRSQSKRTEAHNFYRRRGYRDLKTQNVFIKRLKPTPE